MVLDGGLTPNVCYNFDLDKNTRYFTRIFMYATMIEETEIQIDICLNEDTR